MEPVDANSAKRAEYHAAADKEFSNGNITKAFELLKKAVDISRVHPGEESSEHSDDLMRLAPIHLELDDIKAATQLVEKVVAIRRKVESDKPWRIAMATSTLRYYKRVEQMTPDDHRSLKTAALAFRDASRLDNIGQTAEAIARAAKGIEQRRKVVGYVDRPLADQIIYQARRMAKIGRKKECLHLFDEGIAAFEDLFGKISRDRCATLSLKARVLQLTDLPAALSLQREAAEGLRTMLGAGHESSRAAWRILATLYREQAVGLAGKAKFKEAISSYRSESEAHRISGAEAWRSREALALADEWQRVSALDKKGEAKLSEALDAAAKIGEVGGIDKTVKALATIDELLGPGSSGSLKVAERLTKSLVNAGAGEDKIDHAYEGLIARLKVERGKDYPPLGNRVVEWADLLSNRGDLLELNDRPAEAAAHYERALKQLSALFGPQNHRSRSALCDLERVRILERATPEDRKSIRDSFALMKRSGKLTAEHLPLEALKLAEDALAMRKRILGAPNREVGFCHYSIGKLMEDTNRFTDAEQHYLDALAHYEPLLGKQHPDCANVWRNLGKVRMITGRKESARVAFQNATDAWKASFGSDNPLYARGLVQLATIALKERDANEAGILLEEAVGILETAENADRDDLARAYNGLAAVYERRQPLSAELLLRKAIVVWKEAGNEVDRAIATDNLANLLSRMGKYADAEPLSADAVASLEKTLGPRNSDTIVAKANRADLLGALGRPSEAAKLLDQNLDVAFALFAASADGGSERDGFMALLQWRTVIDGYLTYALDGKTSPEEVYRRVVQWKAAVFGRQRGDRFARRSPELAHEVENARRAVRHLATLCVSIPEEKDLDAWRKSVREAAAGRDVAERALAVAVKRWNEKAGPAKGATIATDLPSSAAFIDFFAYRKVGHGGNRDSSCILAFILRPDHPMQMIDLGDSTELNKAVDTWRSAKTEANPPPLKVDPVEPLRKLIVTPLAAALTDAKLVLNCPDGPLARVPLAALPHPKSQDMLIRTTLFVTVPHISQIPERGILEAWIAESAAKPDGIRSVEVSPSLLTIGSLDYGPKSRIGFSFGALANTAAELNAVNSAFSVAYPGRTAASLTAGAATSTTVKSAMKEKTVIHFATHGYLVPDVMREYLMRADSLMERRLAIGIGGTVGEWRAASLLGSGMLSGIALSGANSPSSTSPGAGVGLLAAAEVGLLDLNAARLAVLSACDSGIGDIAEAEAVLGLQRAFHVAGAEMVIASLWKVNDAATAKLIAAFYRELWEKGRSTPVALRRAQLELLTGSPDGGSGPVREPDFGSAKKLVASAGKPDPTRLWAAFTVSTCRDDSSGRHGKP